MDALIAILSLGAAILAVIGSALPLIAYWAERKKRKDDNTSRDTDKPSRGGPIVGSGEEV
jgi:hypothetical protein